MLDNLPLNKVLEVKNGLINTELVSRPTQPSSSAANSLISGNSLTLKCNLKLSRSKLLCTVICTTPILAKRNPLYFVRVQVDHR